MEEGREIEELQLLSFIIRSLWQVFTNMVIKAKISR
jgi:hypothetical protein